MADLPNTQFETAGTLRHIRSPQDLSRGLSDLRRLDPALADLAERLPDIPLRRRQPGFEGLADIITSQLVSRASATAIFDRLTRLIRPFEPHTFLAAGTEPLVAAGLSRAKQRTLTGLAQAIADQQIDLEALCDLPVDDAHRQLVALKGIGPWTADVFLLFCAGHVDIFPAGDIALQHALAHFHGLGSRPDIRDTAELATRWSPLRSVAARVLYASYADLKGRDALPLNPSD